MSKETGGPAFPGGQKEWISSSLGWQTYEPAFTGMSLRDWFAGQALTGLLANCGRLTDISGHVLERTPSVMAKLSYELADQMLREREK